jgi:hypothetical protein
MSRVEAARYFVMNIANHANRTYGRSARNRGAAAVLAMMFLVIFSSLAAAMAIVSQGNLATADNHLKINRTLATAETGMNFLMYRLNQVAATITTREGLIDSTIAQPLWVQTRLALINDLAGDFQYQGQNIYTDVNGTLHVPAIAVGPSSPAFTAELTPHPLVGEDYNAAYYARPPYSNMNPAVDAAAPLDATWIRIKVIASEGPTGREIYRSISMDFKLDKKIRYALLSRSRVMIGRNVVIDGPLGSRFMETHLPNGHPIQIESDFHGLHPDLDSQLDALVGALIGNGSNSDVDGDNRIDINNPSELGTLDPTLFDVNRDGYIDGYDFFLAHFDTIGNDGQVTLTELESGLGSGLTAIHAAQLMELIDTFGDPNRAGYNDGIINICDRYAKIRGEIYISAGVAGWNAGAAGGNYQDYFQGPIHPDYQEAALTFAATENDAYQFAPSDFDVSSFRTLASGDLAAQALAEAATNPGGTDPNGPQPLGHQANEAVPYGAAHPYDYYDRPIYENMTFTNVAIPRGTNALFRNCTFIGITFIETETNNTHPNYNYAGMQESDGSLKHPDRTVTIGGVQYNDTKTISNNTRFDSCTFEGAIVSDSPNEFTHTRNKIAFTGQTRFEIENSTHLNDSEKQLYRRSTLLVPNYSVELGSFIDATGANEMVNLSGTIVTGILDMRGQVKVNGTILTTFEPTSNTGPVLGNTSPQFNTTLGYFASAAGDLEAELPATGLGVIQVRYDPTLPLPDGILGPIEVRAQWSTYFEGGR